MKFNILLAALTSASLVFAQEHQHPPMGYKEAPELVEDTPNLELRQNLGANPNVAANPTQVPPVTIYTIATQVGATAAQKIITYTQLFESPLDQWPTPKPGTIGMGNLHKRDVEAAVETEVGTVVETIVMAMETEVVVQPLQRVTEVLVLQTMDVISSVLPIETTQTQNSTTMASHSVQGFRPLGTGTAVHAAITTG